jgi:hypothetical protein
MVAGVQTALPCEPQSARRARQALEPFRELMDETRFGDLRLLVSELVAEAIWSPDSPNGSIRVRANRKTQSVRASVEAGAASFPTGSVRPEPGEPGWGVYLVERLSDRWGLRRSQSAASVWFEMFLPRSGGVTRREYVD